MDDGKPDSKSPIEALFDEARAQRSIDYIFTLVRVSGLTSGVRDPFLDLHSALQEDISGFSDDARLSLYCLLAGSTEPLCLVANLLNCISKKPYDMLPFQHLNKGTFPNIIRPTISEITQESVRAATDAGKHDIAEIINEAYPTDVLGVCPPSEVRAETDRVRTALGRYRTFLSALLDNYSRERLEYRGKPILHKLPNFEVLELLVNEEYGLYGFRMHFSNGSSAIFARYPDSTECTNVELGSPLGFFVGNLDQLRAEWRIGDKRLYEVGLSGRYNVLGEWKPILYPGDADSLLKEIRALSRDDDIQGSLFYMMTTGHRVIEFVARTSIELPRESVTFGRVFHLWKCPPLKDFPDWDENVQIYDGTIELDSAAPEVLRSAIATIGIALNRMAFAYDAHLDWRLKYRMIASSGACAVPTEEDLNLLDSLLKKFPGGDDAQVLDAALDWYNRGRSSRNLFTAFLCFYIALESVAIAVANGEADFGLRYSPETGEDRNRRTIDCIQAKHESLYGVDPISFVEEAYFECVLSLKEKTRRVSELVFGRGSAQVSRLFEKHEGYSLSDIRGRLAHGAITLVRWEDEGLVASRLGEMRNIAQEFLSRLIFLVKPSEALPSWSGLFRSGMALKDPRNALYVTDVRMLPTTDWRIRPEWCS